MLHGQTNLCLAGNSENQWLLCFHWLPHWLLPGIVIYQLETGTLCRMLQWVWWQLKPVEILARNFQVWNDLLSSDFYNCVSFDVGWCSRDTILSSSGQGQLHAWLWDNPTCPWELCHLAAVSTLSPPSSSKFRSVTMLLYCALAVFFLPRTVLALLLWLLS